MPKEPSELKSGNLVQKRGEPGKIGLVISVQQDKKVRVEWGDSMQVFVEEPQSLERFLRPGEIV